MEFAKLKVTQSKSESGEITHLDVELDHGKVNACGSEVIADFERLTALVSQTRTIRSMTMFSRKQTSSGKQVFVAGADVTERVGWTDEAVIAHVKRQREALLALKNLPIFTTVVVDGLALGLGTELMLAFDYRIAGPNAKFALPETGLGIIPGALGSSLLASVVGLNHALRLGCTGEQINCDEAARIGLVDEVVSSLEAGLERGKILSQHVAKKSPRAIAGYKAAVLGSLTTDIATRVDVENQRYVTQVRNGDAARGREAFKAIRAGETPSWPSR